MATITGLTADRMLAIEAATVISGVIDGSGHLILTQHDGTEIDAGNIATAIPAASTAASGIVELATGTETAALTDTIRAVTPAGLASALKATVIALVAETGIPSAYPSGVSLMPLTTGSGWSLNSGFGSVITHNVGTDRCVQTFYSNSGGTTPALMWIRIYNSTSGGGGWTAWQQLSIMNNLVAASFAQTTAATSYPAGASRLYYTTSTSGSWDFTGKAGEVLTYRDVANDFTKQQWIKHQGGTGASTELWQRTSNTASGWSSWVTIAGDTDWISISYASGYNATGITQLAYRVKGGVVYFRGGANGTFTSATIMTIAIAGAIPAAYRPAVNIRGGAFGAAARPSVFGILTDGSIIAGSGGLSSQPTTVEFCASYPLTGF